MLYKMFIVLVGIAIGTAFVAHIVHRRLEQWGDAMILTFGLAELAQGRGQRTSNEAPATGADRRGTAACLK